MERQYKVYKVFSRGQATSPPLRHPSRLQRNFLSHPDNNHHNVQRAPSVMAPPSLDDLPVELVERVVDYLPHRETLLYLRLVSPTLNAKVARRFYMNYFISSAWTLKSASSRAIVHFSHCPDVAAHLTSVTLIAPCAHHAIYDNIWMAKAIEPAKIARALSLFTEIRVLRLRNFGSIQGLTNISAFFQPFVSNLYLPKLQILDLFQVDIQADDATQLLKKHGQTIQRVELDRINLLYKPDTDAPEHETPWFDLLYSMKEFKNHCSISIEWAKQDGRDARLEPPWEDWFDQYDGNYEYEGLDIIERRDDPDDEDWMGSMHFVVEIEGDEHWWNGVKRVAAFNIFSIMLGEEEDEGLACMMCEPGDVYWERKTKECLKLKDDAAAKRKTKAAAALRKQEQEAAGSAMMHRWLKN